MQSADTLGSEARVTTALPGRYLEQLCKHFGHKLPVSREESESAITFETGTCRLRAEDNSLVLHCSAKDADGLARLEDVIAKHLKRFAFREEPEVRWVRV